MEEVASTKTRQLFNRVSSDIIIIVIWVNMFKKVKWSRYRPGVAQRVGRGIALLFHGRGTRRGWVVSSTPRPHFTPGKDPVPILQDAEWAPGPVWTGGKSRSHWDSIPDHSTRSQSLYRLSYPAHDFIYLFRINRALQCTVFGGFRIWFPVLFRDMQEFMRQMLYRSWKNKNKMSVITKNVRIT